MTARVTTGNTQGLNTALEASLRRYLNTLTPDQQAQFNAGVATYNQGFYLDPSRGPEERAGYHIALVLEQLLAAQDAGRGGGGGRRKKQRRQYWGAWNPHEYYGHVDPGTWNILYYDPLTPQKVFCEDLHHHVAKQEDGQEPLKMHQSYLGILPAETPHNLEVGGGQLGELYDTYIRNALVKGIENMKNNPHLTPKMY